MISSIHISYDLDIKKTSKDEDLRSQSKSQDLIEGGVEMRVDRKHDSAPFID
jgi:hypothetical protein